jgi:hypothetical protein
MLVLRHKLRSFALRERDIRLSSAAFMNSKNR